MLQVHEEVFSLFFFLIGSPFWKIDAHAFPEARTFSFPSLGNVFFLFPFKKRLVLGMFFSFSLFLSVPLSKRTCDGFFFPQPGGLCWHNAFLHFGAFSFESGDFLRAFCWLYSCVMPTPFFFFIVWVSLLFLSIFRYYLYRVPFLCLDPFPLLFCALDLRRVSRASMLSRGLRPAFAPPNIFCASLQRYGKTLAVFFVTIVFQKVPSFMCPPRGRLPSF